MADYLPLREALWSHTGGALDARRPVIVGVAGSVAVGKSTFAAYLQREFESWPQRPSVVNIATDGYLFSNAVLATRNIAMRKGFPESYDVDALRAALAAIKQGGRVTMPRYSHVTYDVDPKDPLIVERPGVLILDGLHLAQIERAGEPRLIDCLIYLTADEAAIETWFTDRLLPLMLAGRDDPASFYYRFRDMDDAGRRHFAARVWQGINLPNLREHIVKDRDAADLVVRKLADHSLSGLKVRTSQHDSFGARYRLESEYALLTEAEQEAEYADDESRAGLFGISGEELLRRQEVLGTSWAKTTPAPPPPPSPVDGAESGAAPIRDRSQVILYSKLIIAAFDSASTYDASQQRNEPPPELWNDDGDYLAALRSLVAELRTLNALLLANSAATSQSDRAASHVKDALKEFLSSYAGTLGKGAGYATIGLIASLLYQLGVGAGVIAQLMAKLKILP